MSEGVPDDLRKLGAEAALLFRGIGRRSSDPRQRHRARSQSREYILQERVDFAPLIETPFGPTKAEIRMMYIWLDQLHSVTTIIRMGRGKMMGVDHNRDLEWVGASAAFVI